MKTLFFVTTLYLILASLADYQGADASLAKKKVSGPSVKQISKNEKNEAKLIDEKHDEYNEIITFDDLKKVRKLTKMEEAVMNNNLTLAHELLKKGEKVYPPDNKIGSPLLYAVFHDNLDMVNFLISHGADVNFKMANGLTPLGLAVTRNQVTVAEVLLEKGADPNAEFGGSRPLEIAEKFGYGLLISLLREKGGTSRNPFLTPQK